MLAEPFRFMDIGTPREATPRCSCLTAAERVSSGLPSLGQVDERLLWTAGTTRMPPSQARLPDSRSEGDAEGCVWFNVVRFVNISNVLAHATPPMSLENFTERKADFGQRLRAALGCPRPYGS